MFTKKLSYSMNDFYMFNEWFPLSENDFYTFNKWFLYSAIDFYIQQEICVFSNLKFVFSNMRNLLNKNHIHSGAKFRCNKIYNQKHSEERKIWCVSCTSSLQVFFLHFSNLLCTLQRWCLRTKFSVPFYCPIGQWTYAKNWDWGRGLVTCMWTFHKFFIWI